MRRRTGVMAAIPEHAKLSAARNVLLPPRHIFVYLLSYNDYVAMPEDDLEIERRCWAKTAQEELEAWSRHCKRYPDDWRVLWRTLTQERNWRTARHLWPDPPPTSMDQHFQLLDTTVSPPQSDTSTVAVSESSCKLSSSDPLPNKTTPQADERKHTPITSSITIKVRASPRRTDKIASEERISHDWSLTTRSGARYRAVAQQLRRSPRKLTQSNISGIGRKSHPRDKNMPTRSADKVSKSRKGTKSRKVDPALKDTSGLMDRL